MECLPPVCFDCLPVCPPPKEVHHVWLPLLLGALMAKRTKLFPLFKIEGVTNRKKKSGYKEEELFGMDIRRPGESGDQRLLEYTRRLGGDQSLAKRVITLEERYPYGTLPELVTFDWLSANGVKFDYQAEVFGGRNVQGGMVPDFVVHKGAVGAAWLVQGGYYHSWAFQQRNLQEGRDLVARLKLKGAYVNGVRIESVIELSEGHILKNRPQVFVYAMNGVTLEV